ncbi:MAG TPA: hypothetical protein VJQ56_07665, partial [Blastocatellia bacterium]|nr:hypothetical protein [Blastocatellia bacterium]
QIDDRALAFTRAEAVELLEGALDDEAAIDALLAWTQGWVAGLQIIRHALEAEQELRDRDINSIITESQTEIFDYFAEKVYRAEPARVRDLLARSSLPRYVTPDILRQALGLDVSADELYQIVRENIFLNRVAGEPDVFIYHPLFRDFLCKQLEEETTPEDRAGMNRSLAVYYAEREDWEPAIHHFFEAGDEPGAAETLIAARRQLLANGQTATVSNYFPRFSESTLEQNFQLYNLMGEMRVIEGDTVNANLMFQTALKSARLAGECKTEAAALAGLAHTAAREHNFIDAIRFAEEAEACVPVTRAAPQTVTVQTAPLESVGLAARIKNVIGAVRSFEGRYTEANDLMEEALKLAHEAGDARLVRTISQNLALPAYMEGDFPAALRYFSRSPISDHSGGQMHPDSITLFLNRAAIYTARGELSLAEQDLESAVELTRVFNLRGFLPRILEARANIARERLHFDAASGLYNDALNEYRRVDADPVKTDLYYERALLEMRKGEHDLALDLINLMIADRKQFRREIEEALGRQMLGRILLDLDTKHRARALTETEAGEPLLRRLQCNYYLAISCYVRARALADRDVEAGARALKEFLSLAERFDYSYFILNEESFHPALNELCLLYGVKKD